MDPVENFRRILRFEQPEWVPYAPPLFELRYFGANHEGFDNPDGDDSPVGTAWVDVWGVGWRKVQPGVMGMDVLHPLAEPSALKGYRWPSPDDERICGQIYRLAEQFRREGQAGAPGCSEALLLSGSHRDTLWEKAYMLVGMENMMVYLLREPGFAREVLARIMDFQMGIARHYIRAGVEFASLGDDLGAQSGPLLSPRLVGGFLVAEYYRLFQYYHDHAVPVGFHSCGHLDAVLDLFADLGVAILNPLQASANDLDAVRARTHGRMALQGGVSSAVVMEGPPERIEAEVRRRLWQLGREGGYVCCPDQSMPYPPEHLRAVRAAVEAYGRYPLEEYL